MTSLLDFKFLNKDLHNEIVIIYKNNDEIYYLHDLNDILKDVYNMPYYIKDDYLKYKSKLLTIEIFESLISNWIKKPNGENRNILTEDLEKIIQIKRDLKLKELL